MSNFNSLFVFAQSLGLGNGCHVMEMTLEMLVPRDVEAGRVPGDDVVQVLDYGTHQDFKVVSSSGAELANQRTLHTYPELIALLHNVYVNPPIEEDEALDEVLDAIRQQALDADLVEGGDDEDEIFQDDDESDEDEVELDADEEVDADDEVEGDDAEAEIISLVKPKAKKGTKKYKAEIDEMLIVLDEYYGAELGDAGLDVATLAEVLDEIFSQTDEFNIDASCPLLDQLSDYVEFE